MQGSERSEARRQGRLQLRIARYVAFAVVASLAVSAVGLITGRQRALERSLERSARTYAALVSPQLAELAEVFSSSGGYILRQRMARLLELNGDVVRLEVTDVQGRVHLRFEIGECTTFPDELRAPRVEDPDLLEAVQDLEVSARRLSDGNGERVYRVVAPSVEEWGRHAFSVVATFSYGSADRQILTSVLWSGLLLMVGLALSFLVAAIVARPITRHVEQLRWGVRRIADGRLEERVRVQSGDEIQELAEAFNAMADTLQQTIGQLRAAYRELESLDQAKADLVANFSHELKTPLTALRGYLELLGDASLGALSPEAERAVAVCEKNVARLARRIEELVQLSQLDKRPPPDLDRDVVSLDLLLNGVVDTLLPRVEEKGISCSLDLASDLALVSGSAEHLERAFLNLLDNAVKFTPESGSIRVTAESHVQDGRPGVLVRVADTGVGIPKGEQLRIFDRFYQVDTSSRRRYGGMGLGLSLVRSIVEAHRGLVWVESQEGSGATFFVWLPSRPPDSGAVRAERRRADSGTVPKLSVDPSAGGEP